MVATDIVLHSSEYLYYSITYCVQLQCFIEILDWNIEHGIQSYDHYNTEPLGQLPFICCECMNEWSLAWVLQSAMINTEDGNRKRKLYKVWGEYFHSVPQGKMLQKTLANINQTEVQKRLWKFSDSHRLIKMDFKPVVRLTEMHLELRLKPPRCAVKKRFSVLVIFLSIVLLNHSHRES